MNEKKEEQVEGTKDKLEKEILLEENNLGYVLGWFCGSTLIFGAIIAVVNLFKRNRRRAFQALILPLGVIAWVFLIMDGISPILPDNEAGATIWVLLLVAGIIFIPIIGLFSLRRLSWPPIVKSDLLKKYLN